MKMRGRCSSQAVVLFDNIDCNVCCNHYLQPAEGIFASQHLFLTVQVSSSHNNLTDHNLVYDFNNTRLTKQLETTKYLVMALDL